MPYVMRIVGLISGGSTPQDGKYLVYYDPSPSNASADTAFLITSWHKNKALKFDTQLDALEEWKRIDTRKPVREDGRPNRPLTAYNILLEEA